MSTFTDIVRRFEKCIALHDVHETVDEYFLRATLSDVVGDVLIALRDEFKEGDHDLREITHMKEIWADEDWSKVVPEVINNILSEK